MRQHPILPLLASAAAALSLGCGDSGAPEAFPIAQPEVYVQDLLEVERVALEVQDYLETTWIGGVMRGDDSLARRALAPDFRGRFCARSACERVDDGGLDISRLVTETQPVLDTDELLAVVFAYVADWAHFDRHEFEPDRFWLEPGAAHAVARADLRLSGALGSPAGAGGRAELRATCDLALIRADDGAWLIERLDVREGVLLERWKPGFVDVTDMVGLHYNESDENASMAQEFIDQHRTLALGGLAAVDWNEDGFPDLIGTRRGQLATLFLNDGGGGFVPGSLPFTRARECGSSLLYVDLDGDGLEELVSSEVLSYASNRAHIGLYTRRAGSWEALPEAFEFENPVGLRRVSVQTVVPLDANGDGRLDLFFAVYGNALSRGAHFNTVEAHDGGDNFLFINRGGLRFEEESGSRGIHGTQYTYVAQAFDFDGDGDQDLFEGNDFGPNVLWLNDGEGHFTADTQLGFGGVSAYSMGLTLADWDNSGRWSLYVSNMSSEQGARLVPLADGISEAMRMNVGVIASGNQLYRQDPDGGAWTEHAAAAHCNEAEWAWASIFCDIDNDGDEDLFVTNGFTSHSNAALGDWQSYYWNQVLADAGSLERGERSVDVNADHPFEGSFNGREHDRLFYAADGDRSRFFEAASVFGLDAVHDGRCAVPIDVDGDGDLDLALWTLQGLRLLENRAAAGHFARFSLVEENGGPALGATVLLTAAGVTRTKRVKIVDGFQSQVLADVHFGLGDVNAIESVLVHWPSGEVQEWNEVPLDARIVLREGSHGLEASPLLRWPEDTRPRAAFPRIDTILPRLGGGSEAVTLPERATVVRYLNELPRASAETTPPALWPDLEALGASHPEARIVVVVPPAAQPNSRPPAAAEGESQVPVLVADESFLLRTFGSAAPPARATLVFDKSARLKRAFLRTAGTGEIARILRELQDEPPFADLLVESGRAALKRGQFRVAGELFERAVAIDDSLASAYEGMARAHVYLGQLQSAEEDYLRAVLADPDYALGHYNLGVTRNNLDRPREAIAPLQEALRIMGEELAALRALGEAALRAELLELAADAYGRAVRLSPEDFELVLTRAKILGKLRRLEEAQRAFVHATKLRPRSSEAQDGLKLVGRLIAERDAADD